MGASADEARRELARRELARRKAAEPAVPAWQDPNSKMTIEERSIAMANAEKRDLGTAAGGLAAGASRLLTGPGQLITAAGEKMGVPGASVEVYNRSVRNMENMIVNPSKESAAIKNVGELTAGTIIPTAKIGQAKTFLGALWAGSKTGAVTGAAIGASTEDNTPGEVGKSAATRSGIGAILGPAIAAVPAAGKAVENFIGRMVGGKPIQEAVELLAERNKSPLFKDMPTSASEATGSPALAALEAKLAGKATFEFQNKKLETFRKNVETLVSSVTGSKDPRVAATKLSEAFGKSTTQLQSTASDEMGRGLKAAYSKAAEAPPTDVIPFSNFKKTLEELSEGIGGTTGPTSSWYRWLDPEVVKSSVQIQEALDIIRRAEEAGERGFNAATVINVRRAANALRDGLNKANMSPTDKARNRIGKAIARAVDADVAAYLGQNKMVAPGQSTATREALEVYRATNDRYRERMGQLKAARQSFAGQAFKTVPRSPGEAMEQLLRSSPEDQIRAINVLQNGDPGALADMKAWKLEQVSQAMNDNLRAGNMAAVDPAAFIKELTAGNKIVGERLWTPKELQDIKSGVAAVRLMLTSMPSGMPRTGAGATDIGRVASAAVTQSPAFLTMQFYNLIGGRKIEKILTDPNAVKILIDLSKNPKATFTKPTATMVQAMSALQAIASRPDDEEPE
jgi:hypothetical protein